MSLLEAVFLGFIQGLTEFFPISSSGHLQLGQHLLGFSHLDHYLFFDLVCHLGTLLALGLFFSEQIWAIFATDRKRLMQIVIGTLPLFPLVLVMKPIKAVFAHPQYLGYCFLVTSLLLYISLQCRVRTSLSPRRQWTDPLLIGLFQAVAVLPGISRSGATLSAGKMLGWQQGEALLFSFLLAIPAILGAVVIESMQLSMAEITTEVGFAQYLIGFVSSFVVGYMALRWLMQLASKGKLIYFVWYCLGIGIFALIYL